MKGKQRSNRGQWLLIVALASGLPSVARAEPVDFQRDVWPIFQQRCIRCHGPEKQKSSLRVDSRAALLKGGDNGPAIVAGEPEKSYLLELVSARKGELRMPPEGDAAVRGADCHAAPLDRRRSELARGLRTDPQWPRSTGPFNR